MLCFQHDATSAWANDLISSGIEILRERTERTNPLLEGIADYCYRS
jgi:hypothetical protein